jgi:hypothetical protein
MSGIVHTANIHIFRRSQPDSMHVHACIKQQFRVFCNKLYYFSNFKDFSIFTLAC